MAENKKKTAEQAEQSPAALKKSSRKAGSKAEAAPAEEPKKAVKKSSSTKAATQKATKKSASAKASPAAAAEKTSSSASAAGEAKKAVKKVSGETKTASKTASKTATKSPAAKKSASSKASAAASKAPAKKSSTSKKKSSAPAAESLEYSIKTPKESSGGGESIPEGEYMNEAQRAYFQRMLEQWRDELIEDSKRTEAYFRDERQPTADLNDRASQEEEFYMELRTRERERKLLNKINKALLRLSRDEFGWCEHCGEEIGLKRLAARPTAELCIDCKEIAERKEKNFLH